jgi:signal transduction histidine kinase
MDDYAEASGATGDVSHERDVHSSVGVPINVDGRLWGVMLLSSRRAEPPPADTEARLVGFTELVATAIANAETRAELSASRARVVAAGDESRRRIERDLHDGIQQHLISLALRARTAQATLPPDAGKAAAALDAVADELTGVLQQLREITRGIHPAALAQGGLRSALKALARRSPVPVRLDVGVDARLPEPVELAAYFTVAEALTNAAKHAHASVVDVRAHTDEAALRIEVRDNGQGGAVAGSGSGLVGLIDRIESLSGLLTVHSPPAGGTSLQVMLPLTVPTGPETATGGADPPSGTAPYPRPSPDIVTLRHEVDG